MFTHNRAAAAGADKLQGGIPERVEARWAIRRPVPGLLPEK